MNARLIDNGPVFNPFARSGPDTDAPLHDREIGGLGILLVRELMDELQWCRENGLNRLYLRKHFAATPRSSHLGNPDA